MELERAGQENSSYRRCPYSLIASKRALERCMLDECLDDELVEDGLGEREQRLVWQRERRVVHLVRPQEEATPTRDGRQRGHVERREGHAHCCTDACTHNRRNDCNDAVGPIAEDYASEPESEHLLESQVLRREEHCRRFRAALVERGQRRSGRALRSPPSVFRIGYCRTNASTTYSN